MNAKKACIIVVFLCAIAVQVYTQTQPAPATTSLLSPQVVEQAVASLEDSVAVVRVYWKILPDDKPSELQSGKNIYKQFAEKETSIDMLGVVIDSQKNIVVFDTCFDLRHLDKIEIVHPRTGTVIPGVLSSVVLSAPIALVKPENPGQADLFKPITFSALTDEEFLSTTFYALASTRKLEKPILGIGLIGPAKYDISSETPGFVLQAPFNIYMLISGYYQSMISDLFSLPIIMNEALKPVGIATHTFLDKDERLAMWKGDSLINAPRRDFKDYMDFLATLEDSYAPALYNIKIDFRQETESDEDDSMYSSFYQMFGYGGEAIEEMETYGLAIDEKILLVPEFIDRKKAAKIKTVTITLDDGKEVEGTFLGTFKDFAMCAVKVDGDVVLQHMKERIVYKDFQPYQPYFSINTEKRLGKKSVICCHFRCYERQKSDENVFRWGLYGEINDGDFIADNEGNLIGLYIISRTGDEEIKQYIGGRKDRYSELYGGGEEWFEPGGDQDLVSMKDIKELLTQPEQHLDPRIKPLTREEEKQKVWLGVEYSVLDKQLSKNLKVEEPTKDGEIGIVVSQIYKNSPAEKIGLKSGDILLSLEIEGRRYPIELQPPEDEFREFDYGRADVPKALEAFGFKMPEKKPWRARLNYFTGLLNTIGPGKEVELTYYSEGSLNTKKFNIETAPPDFESAKKFKDDDIGLTLKDLTYEVRAALQIPEEESGAVVAKVETGTHASVAGIKVYEIITSVNDETVTDTDDFKNKIQAAQEAGKDKVSLRILTMGKSRVVDLKLPAKKTAE